MCFSVRGQIRTTVGQAQLLLAQRFKQFTGLVDDCEFQRGEKETTCTDLQGFWDMIYYQVEDVDAKFVKLDKLKEANWQEEKPRKKTVSKKKQAASKSAKPDAKPAARSKFAEFRAKMAAQRKEASAAAMTSALEREEPTVSGDVLAVFAMPSKVTVEAAPAVLIYEKPQADKPTEKGAGEANLTEETAKVVTEPTLRSEKTPDLSEESKYIADQ